MTPLPELVTCTERLLRALAREPDRFRFEAVQDRVGWSLTGCYSPDDHPRVIGRLGEVIKAVQRIVEGMADCQGESIRLELLPPVRVDCPNPPAFHSNPNWPQHRTVDLFRQAVRLVNPTLSMHEGHTELTTVLGLSAPPDGIVDQQLIQDLRLLFWVIGRSCGRKIAVEEFQAVTPKQSPIPSPHGHNL
jgi:predicted RNA-binding protein YlqC (UPF0109 family)